MPSAANDFRPVCGCFVPVFIGFMVKRAKKKMVLRVAILTLRRRIDGVTFGLVLSYLFWGSLLLRCGDIESNPGPPPAKDTMRQTRLASTGTSRRISLEKARESTTPVTSTLPEPTLSDIMATLRTMSDQMSVKLDDVKKEVHDLREDYAALHSELKGLKEEMSDLRKENQELQRTNDDLCKKLEDYNHRIDDLEGRSKRNNLIFYGLPRRDDERNADCEGIIQDLITDKLELTDSIEFDRVHRLSAKKDSPIIARCVFYKQKVNILKSKGKLRGSNVFVGEDFSAHVRDLRRRLTPHLKKARQDGKRATMIYNYLLIDGKKYSVDNEERLVDAK